MNNKDTRTSRGRKKTKSGLVPVATTSKPAPDSRLQRISCKCKKGCQRNCGCRKTGLYCSPICTTCKGLCENVEPPNDNVETDEEGVEERDQELSEEERSLDLEGMSNRKITSYYLLTISLILQLNLRCCLWKKPILWQDL